jgi:Mg/Co/Ni transporter MgtE
MDTDTIIIEQFIQDHGEEAARTLEKLEPAELAAFFSDSSAKIAFEVMPKMNPHLISTVIERMEIERSAKIFESMDTQYALLLIRMMKNDLSKKILDLMTPEKSSILTRLLKYYEYSVGSFADPMVLTLTEKMTVKEAREEVKRHKKRVQPNLFVLNTDRKLAGVINLSDLISEDPKKEISSIMDTKINALPPETPIQSLLNHQDWKDLYALPVVDNASMFLGIIKLETIRSILTPSEERKERLSEDTVSALGELYQLGLAGLLKSATDLRSDSKEPGL